MGTMVLRKMLEAKFKRKDTKCTKATSKILLHRNSMVIILIVKSLDIEKVNANLSQIGLLISQKTHLEMVILMIETITQGIVATTVKNMNMFLKIA